MYACMYVCMCGTSGRLSSCPERISWKPLIVSYIHNECLSLYSVCMYVCIVYVCMSTASCTNLPPLPVKTSATWKGCDMNLCALLFVHTYIHTFYLWNECMYVMYAPYRALATVSLSSSLSSSIPIPYIHTYIQ